MVLPDYIAHQRDPVGGPDDSDLSVVQETISQRNNGLSHLQEAVRESQFNDADELLMAAVWAGDDVLPTDVIVLLDANAIALDRLRDALTAPHFRLPEAAADEFEFAPEIPLETQRLVDLLRLQAQHNASLGDWDTAFDNALDILRLARRVEGANRAVLTTTMLSIGYRAEGLETLRHLVADAPLGSIQARRWVGELPSYRSDPSAWKRMWAVEYQQWKSLLAWISDRAVQASRLDSQSNPSSELADLDIDELREQTRRTLEMFAHLTRIYQKASESDCTALRDLPFPRSQASYELLDDDASEIAFQIEAPDYRDFFLRRCAEDTALAATQTLIGLRAFQQDRGRLPEKLSELVPDYLEAIPIDAFRGEPMQYSRARKLVYSLGTDGIDNYPSEIMSGNTDENPVDGTEPTGEFSQPSYPIEF
jgi:hypothetical protein